MRLSRRRREIKLVTIKENEDGIVAFASGVISAISFVVLVLVSFAQGGKSNAGIGLIGLFSLIFAIVGLVYGTLNIKKGDRTFFFTKAGFFINVIMVLLWVIILIFGLYN
ncbi:MAG: hypothetical protein E7241_00960 [Lachnospiraceae bacterium]|nr:hypothetical protein [Lachnospiraceae bacterium]